MVDFPFTSRWFDLPEGRLHYVDEGQGEPIVMVHGNPTWSYLFRHLLADLRSDHRVIALDHIGCGRSDKPPDSRYAYVLERRVADLGRLLDHLEPTQRLTLVLHDWGGMIGLAWACRHPERVGRIILGNTSAFPLPATKALPLSLRLARVPGLGALMVRGLNGFCRGAVRYCVTSRRLGPEEAAAYLAPYGSWADRRAVLRFVQDIPLAPTHPSWPTLAATAEKLALFADQPTLILWGRRDFVFDDHFLNEWRRRWPRAEVHVFEQAGHFIFEDAAAEIDPIVREFLSRTPLAV
ncbi:MAG TPA: alpha/beta fold hydrolase [Gemmatales bacterium]|nr:alpha/beta fold hydrolase [Gemmatales bacterium]